MINVCSFETEVKGVMFYDGRKDLHTDTFVHVYFERDTENVHHPAKAFFVKLCSNNKILGHLNFSTAEVIYEIYQEGINVKFLGSVK